MFLMTLGVSANPTFEPLLECTLDPTLDCTLDADLELKTELYLDPPWLCTTKLLVVTGLNSSSASIPLSLLLAKNAEILSSWLLFSSSSSEESESRFWFVKDVLEARETSHAWPLDSRAPWVSTLPVRRSQSSSSIFPSLIFGEKRRCAKSSLAAFLCPCACLLSGLGPGVIAPDLCLWCNGR